MLIAIPVGADFIIHFSLVHPIFFILFISVEKGRAAWLSR